MVKKMKNKFNSEEELAKWNDAMVKKYHSEGTLFESKNPVLRYIEKKRIKTMVKLAQISANDRLLDMGCGEGYLLSLIPKIERIAGLDISRVALEKATTLLKNRPYIELKYGDAQNTPFNNDSFDKIICSELLEHVPYPRLVIKEINRLLKRDGLLVISVPDEKRIQKIMHIFKSLKLDKFIFSARKQEDYEWHLHESNLKFIKKITKGLFRIVTLKRVPFMYGYRFIIKLEKLSAGKY